MLLERLGKVLLFVDGGMGALLQAEGLLPGESPEDWNIEHSDVIQKIQRAYFEAGSDIVLANTFGANAIKYHSNKYELRDIIHAAVYNAKCAAKEVVKDERLVYIGLDIGPTGKLLKPLGDLDFETAYEAYGEVVKYGVEAGADMIHIETMSDLYELKAAVLAAKEYSDLPVFATVVLDAKGKMLTGGDVKSVVALLEGLRVDAIGFNCSLGPEQMMDFLDELEKYTSLPIIMKPNAGLPKQRDGETYYDVNPNEFANAMSVIVDKGACVVGGCCGTTPEHIAEMVNCCKNKKVKEPTYKTHTLVSSYGKTVEIGDCPIIIGERINPTGKKRLKQALKDHDLDYILREGIMQEEKGAHVLDVNVGLPDINEVEMMKEVILELQSVSSTPLQIDTVNVEAMEAAMRIYNGKPMINSVNGKQESMSAVFPLVKKYGGVVVGLTLDESGIPETAEGRADIAGKIIEEAENYGIPRKDIVIDVLTLTISSEPESAKITLEALKLVRERYGVRTVLGVSNVSFGLPNRAIINSYFYTMAMQAGLSAGIINPSSEAMMRSYYSYCALMGYDANCQSYIEMCANQIENNVTVNTKEKMNLHTFIVKGLKEEAAEATKALLEQQEPLKIIEEHLIPALDVVGKGFESGTVFLPQLLMSAEAAKLSFEVLKKHMAQKGEVQQKHDRIVLATVKGDIHDIGKNIVKVLLENYGFEVLDLGKDVSVEVIVETVLEEKIRLVGLSALMTTTVVSMEETIKELHEKVPECKVMVGGAVLNQEYADMIGADFYGKDAMQSVYYAKELFS